MAGNDAAFLNTETWKGKLFLGGWTAAGKAQDVLEPATGAVLTNVGMATPADVAEAAKRARAAQPGWAGMPYEQLQRYVDVTQLQRLEELRIAAFVCHAHET